MPASSVGVCFPAEWVGLVTRAAIAGLESMRELRSLHIRRIWGESEARSETSVTWGAVVDMRLGDTRSVPFVKGGKN